MPNEQPTKWVLLWSNSLDQLNATELVCGAEYALEMAMVLDCIEIDLVIDNLIPIILWPKPKGITWKAVDGFGYLAQQLMIMYTRKL